MVFKRQIFSVSLVGVFCVVSSAAFAAGSGSYRVETPDAHAMGMGSAFVGEADTPAAIYYNPAGINQMKTLEATVGTTVLAPRTKMTQPGGNVVHMQNNEFYIPHLYVAVPMTSKISVGYGSSSYWGLGTNWGLDSPLRYATTQASIKTLENSLVASYQITSQWSFAVSLDNDFIKGNESKAFTNLTFGADGGEQLRGTDDAWGYRIAAMFKLNERHQIGLMYRSRVNHDLDGKVYLTGISPTFQALYGFSGSEFITSAHMKLTLPQSVVLGYSFRPTSRWTINADLEWMDWSSTKYETLRFPDATATQLGFLNSGNPTSDDWHSAWSEAIGAQYDLTDRFRVRAGYYHHERVIPQATFNPKIPDRGSNGYATGFGYDINRHVTLDVAYSALVFNTRNIVNTVGPPGSVNGKYRDTVYMGLVSLTYKF